MSSDAQGTSGGGGGGRRASIGNFFRKVRNSVRGKKTISTPVAPPGESKTAAPAAPAAQTAPAAPPKPSEPVQQPQPPTSHANAADDQLLEVDRTEGADAYWLPRPRNADERDRMRELLIKYGIEIDLEEFVLAKANDYPERVHKPIRQRVYRICHRCNSRFASEKTCTNCRHRRCTKCPRYPQKKLKPQIADPATVGSGGKDSDGRDPGDRGFDDKRDEDKGPEGKESQRTEAKTSAASATTEPAGNTNVRTQAGAVVHGLCHKPKKTKQEVDPELLKAVEARIAQLNLGSAIPLTTLTVTIS
ncbi:MAG: hypothetical protein M1820_000956 [Bogoriella megaspora]|nr:MAG: hypothetical protein M1820_000956 [Bogoriella megaspora]